MLTLETSPEAEADLLDIWLYIAKDQPTNADRFLDRLQEKALKLAEFPDMGRDRPELAKGLKSFPVDRYNIYYCVIGSALVLVRILPGSRDIDALF
ncbi:type II toxin-antitoxin system RelE/ParE family toxin [Microbulbifer rhizosphaerae]|uniref:Toxin ParE1/3/4 n=1 Tax=Microbulbifer rhizosphaerae TaxID=1562603 RepID=A0A7W4W9D3_9GAMM|nr:type II toxin-antitoxin system RelE/ParE family toxin [Microbulbifer rhizosphaerae]MBB3059436.1 toxin ParE1/3/4 [Microbulbifer rhizosphaerae]